jgi:hypothetical protein
VHDISPELIKELRDKHHIILSRLIAHSSHETAPADKYFIKTFKTGMREHARRLLTSGPHATIYVKKAQAYMDDVAVGE